MKQTLYSLRTHVTADGTPHDYFITKFVDGEVESAYALSASECTCPAGHRPSCRHRQMLPEMIARGLVNTHWFWDFDIHRAVDFNGMLKSNFDAMNELAAEPTGPQDVVAEGAPSNKQEDAPLEGVIIPPNTPEFAVPLIGRQITVKVKTPLPQTSWRRI